MVAFYNKIFKRLVLFPFKVRNFTRVPKRKRNQLKNKRFFIHKWIWNEKSDAQMQNAKHSGLVHSGRRYSNSCQLWVQFYRNDTYEFNFLELWKKKPNIFLTVKIYSSQSEITCRLARYKITHEKLFFKKINYCVIW